MRYSTSLLFQVQPISTIPIWGDADDVPDVRFFRKLVNISHNFEGWYQCL